MSTNEPRWGKRGQEHVSMMCMQIALLLSVYLGEGRGSGAAASGRTKGLSVEGRGLLLFFSSVCSRALPRGGELRESPAPRAPAAKTAPAPLPPPAAERHRPGDSVSEPCLQARREPLPFPWAGGGGLGCVVFPQGSAPLFPCLAPHPFTSLGPKLRPSIWGLSE